MLGITVSGIFHPENKYVKFRRVTIKNLRDGIFLVDDADWFVRQPDSPERKMFPMLYHSWDEMIGEWKFRYYECDRELDSEREFRREAHDIW